MRLRTRRASWAVLAFLLGTACSLAAVASAAEEVDEALLPVDLTVNTFDGALQGLPADRWALIEFFASWCPACQHFKPTYEQVSAALRREPLQQPEVWVARVDCAKEVRITRQLQNTRHHCSVTHCGQPADAAWVFLRFGVKGALLCLYRLSYAPALRWVHTHL